MFYIVPSARIFLDDHDTRKDTWSVLKVRSKYYLPVLKWLPHYNGNLFLGDMIAGLTLACLLIPQSLSYATALCKVPAAWGLYSIAFPAMTYAVSSSYTHNNFLSFLLFPPINICFI